MSQYVGPFDEGQSIAPAGGVQRFVPIIVGSELRIPLEPADEGEPYAFVLTGRYDDMPKKADTELTAGGTAYYDPDNEEFTDDDTKFPAGTYPDGAASDAETVKVNFFPAGANDTELAGKADKDADAVENNLAKFDASGNPVDSGISENGIPLAGTVTITGTDTTAAVDFGAELADTDYAIILTQGAPTGSAVGSEAPWYTAKATTGFTVNIATAPGGTDTTEIDWIAVPLRNPA